MPSTTKTASASTSKHSAASPSTTKSASGTKAASPSSAKRNSSSSTASTTKPQQPPITAGLSKPTPSSASKEPSTGAPQRGANPPVTTNGASKVPSTGAPPATYAAPAKNGGSAPQGQPAAPPTKIPSNQGKMDGLAGSNGAAAPSQNGGAAPYNMGGNSMYGMGGGLGMNGTNYGMDMNGMNAMNSNLGGMNNGMGNMGGYGMGGSAYGGGMGGPMGSMYGMGGPMGGPMGSMYGMGGPMGGPMGSMYSFGAPGSFAGNPMLGSVYGQLFSSMYGPQSGQSGYFSGSLYGGNMFGNPGSLYGQGGSLYGRNDAGSVMGSMYGFGSMYESFRPHTNLGVVRKADIPFSYTFNSGLGMQGLSSRPSAFLDMRQSSRANSFSGSVAPTSETGEVAGYIRSTDEARHRAPPAGGDSGNVTLGRTRSLGSERDMAPKSPTKTNESASHIKLSTNYNIQTVAVVGTSSSSADKVKVVSDTKVSVAGKEVEFGEVVSTPADAKEVPSKKVDGIFDHLIAGHNTALLVSDDSKSKPLADAVVLSSIKRLTEKLSSELTGPKNKFQLRCNMFSHKKDTTKDLLVKGAKEVPMELGGSPLFGPAIVNQEQKTFATAAEFESLYKSGMANAKSDDSLVLITVVLKIIKEGASASEKFDVYISSLIIAVSREGTQVFDDVSKKKDPRTNGMFRYAVHGPSVTVAVVCVRDDNEGAANVLEQLAQLKEVKNMPPRSGNVRRFMDFSAIQLKNTKARVEAASGTEKAEETKNVERLGQILADTKELLEDPEHKEPKVYHTNRRAPESEERTVPRPASAQARAPTSGSSSENVIRTVAVVDGNSSSAYSIDGNTINSSGSAFNVTEVVKKETIQNADMKSSSVQSVVNSFVVGDNGSFVSLDSTAVAAGPFDSPSFAAVRQAVNASLNTAAKSKVLRASFALVRKTEAKDLTISGDWSKLRIASSPLFGPVVHNATLHRVNSTSDFEALLNTAKKISGNKWEPDTVLLCNLVHFFTNEKDSYVSSLSASFACKDGMELYNMAMTQKPPMAEIFRYAFGGTAATVFITSLAASDDVSAVASALRMQDQASKVKNRPLRTGSIKEFVGYTKSSIEKKKEAAKNETDPKKKEAIAKVLVPMEKMLADHQEVLNSPERNFPVAYGPESGADRATAATPATTAKTVGFDNCQLVAFVPRPTAEGERKVTVDGKDYAFDEVVQYTSGAEGTRTKPSVTMAEVEKCFLGSYNSAILSASNVDCSCAEEPVWMFFSKIVSSVFENKQSGDTVLLDISFAIISQDTVLVDLLAPNNQSCPLSFDTSPLFGSKVHGLKMEQASSAEEVSRILKAAFDQGARHIGKVRQAGALMVGSAIQRRQLADGKVFLCSLSGMLTGPQATCYTEALENARVARLELLNRPLNGPSTTVALLNYKSEDASTAHMTRTVCSLAKRRNVVANPVRSVDEFIAITEHGVRVGKEALDKAPPHEKAHLQHRLERTENLLNEHRRFRDDVRSAVPAYLSSWTDSQSSPMNQAVPSPAKAAAAERAVSPAKAATSPGTHVQQPTSATSGSAGSSSRNASKIATLAVVTSSREASGPVALEVQDATHLKFTADGAERSIEFTETVARADNSSTIRSVKLDELADCALNGYNTALLCTDTPNSHGCDAVVLRTVRAIFSQLPSDSEVYYFLDGIKGDKAKDFLTPGSGYTPVQWGNSPLFGPCVNGSALKRLTDVSSFERNYNTALSTCANDGALCAAVLVLKHVLKSENDVSLASLLIAVDTTGTGEPFEAISRLDKKDRGLFQYAVGGSCSTVAVLGLTDRMDKEQLTSTVKSYTTLTNLEGSQQRSGSVRRFYDYAEATLQTIANKASSLPAEEREAFMKTRYQRLDVMRQDAKSLLDNPKGTFPQYYLSNTGRS